MTPEVFLLLRTRARPSLVPDRCCIGISRQFSAKIAFAFEKRFGLNHVSMREPVSTSIAKYGETELFT